MPDVYAVPPIRNAGDTGHILDHQQIRADLNLLQSNSYAYGPTGDTTGATDTTGIQNILGSSNPVVQLGVGTYYYKGTLTVPANGRLLASGGGATAPKA